MLKILTNCSKSLAACKFKFALYKNPNATICCNNFQYKLEESIKLENFLRLTKIERKEISLLKNEIELKLDKEEILDINKQQLICDIFDIPIKDDPNLEKVHRPPVVSIMGHIDHGKTTLLDSLKKSNYAAKEFGKITQSIGAFQFQWSFQGEIKKITLIDTPGHEVFMKMRQIGAAANDLIILVISAVEGIQQQTIEVLNLIETFKIPYIIAINKIDREGSDPEKVILELYNNKGIEVEQLGGQIKCVEISALYSKNLDILVKEIVDLSQKNNVSSSLKGRAKGIVIESKKNQIGGYYSASVIGVSGMLANDISFICGNTEGKVKQMVDENNQILNLISPGYPISITGFKSIPEPGKYLLEVRNSNDASKIIKLKKKIQDYKEHCSYESRTAEESCIFDSIRKKIHIMNITNIATKEINLTKKIKSEDSKSCALKLQESVNNPITFANIKASTSGALEAIMNRVGMLISKSPSIKIGKTSVGPLSESDISDAEMQSATLFCFDVDYSNKIAEIAEEKNVIVKIHKIIYQLEAHFLDFINDIEILQGNKYENAQVGLAEIKEIFKIQKKREFQEAIGIYVRNGILDKNKKFRLITPNGSITELKIESMKINKLFVDKIDSGNYGGLLFDSALGFNISKNDYIECYEKKERIRKFKFKSGIELSYNQIV